MFDRVLKGMRELVRTRNYVMTVHAENEMDVDGLSISDVERVILTGHITQRQQDRASGRWKYLVTGQSIAGDPATVVAKVSPTGRLVFITVFRE